MAQQVKCVEYISDFQEYARGWNPRDDYAIGGGEDNDEMVTEYDPLQMTYND